MANPSSDTSCSLEGGYPAKQNQITPNNYIAMFKQWPPTPTSVSDPWYPVWKSIIRDCWGGIGADTDPNAANYDEAVKKWRLTGTPTTNSAVSGAKGEPDDNYRYRCNFLYEIQVSHLHLYTFKITC